jgi:histidinol dehydrogenase
MRNFYPFPLDASIPSPAVLQRLDLRGAGDDLHTQLPRPQVAGAEPRAAVREILADVRARGDRALLDLTERFDGARLDSIAVTAAACEAARGRLAPEVVAALEAAADSIRDFQESEVTRDQVYVRGGLTIRTLRRPVDRAGCYVPGGRAAYPSTVLMTAVPAKVAGVPEVVLCVPPDRDGRVPDSVLAAAAIAGVDEVHRVGGAQAVAALAYGTETIRAVDVIVGPGNVYVALAKREVAGEGLVGVPSSFAGPSEVVVVADASAPVQAAALDIVVQAEHGPGGLAWLVTWDPDVADAITQAVAGHVARAERRVEIEATLAEGGWCVLVDGPEDAMVVANAIAPEHLQLMTRDDEALVARVRHAGAVFCGPLSPASLGDYWAGPSHVLPTNGSARFSGALTPDDFTKPVHVIQADRAALEVASPHVEALASIEGLAAHAESIRIRRELR